VTQLESGRKPLLLTPTETYSRVTRKPPKTEKISEEVWLLESGMRNNLYIWKRKE